jgi:hypothetical protein
MPERKGWLSTRRRVGRRSRSRQGLAAPEHDWMGEEPVLVDEHGGDELAHEPDAAGGHDVPARLGLQRSDVVAAPQHRRALPLGVLQRA